MSVTIGTETDAYLAFERLRWGGNEVSCPHCNQVGRCAYLPPQAGVRQTRTGQVSHRRVWKCLACRRQFSVLTGTIFEGTRVDLRIWIAVIADWQAGVGTAADLSRRYGITQETARHMIARLSVDENAPPLDQGC